MADRALAGLILLVAAAYGAYLFWRKQAAAGGAASAGSAGPPPPFGPPVPGKLTQRASGQSDLDVLLGFVRAEGLPEPSLGQTTGGQHNPGSLHYQGKAVDIGARNLSPQRAAQIIRDALAAGFHVIDERVRPKGQAVWGGPNIHLDTGPLSRFAQAAP